MVGNISIKYNDWCENDVRFVNDLLTDKGHFLKYTDFCILYQVHPNILKYYGIVNAIKVNGHVLIQEVRKPYNLFNPWFTICFSNSQKVAKFSINIFSSPFRNRTVVPINVEKILKWPLVRKSGKICTRPMRITHYTKLQWLQFRMLNTILGTNSLLF